MPIGVDDAFDPDDFDTFIVKRRTEVVGDDGTATYETQNIPDVQGVVIPNTTRLTREEGSTYLSNTLQIITQFRLQGPSPNRAADIVEWNGDDYVVVTLGDYTRYGSGFVSATLSGIQSVNNPPTE